MTSPARGQHLPDSDTIGRYCRPKELAEFTGEVTHESFSLRRQDKGALSVNWLELLHPTDRTTQLKGVRQHWMRVDGKFAILNVKKTIDDVAVETRGRVNLEICYAPTLNNQSHSSILGSSMGDLEAEKAICESIVEVCIVEVCDVP